MLLQTTQAIMDELHMDSAEYKAHAQGNPLVGYDEMDVGQAAVKNQTQVATVTEKQEKARKAWTQLL